MSAPDHPVDGQVVMLAGAKASVTLSRLPHLLARVQAVVGEEADDYDRRFEAAVSDPDRTVYLVPPDHWDELGDRLAFDDRETDAARRSHEEQLLRCGSETDRREEFEAALDIRSAVVVGR